MLGFIDKTIAAGLLVAVVFTTLALGTVEAWSVAIFELIALALLVLWALKAIAERRLRITMPAAGWPLAGLVVLGLAQSAAFADAPGRVHSLSMDVEATRGAVTVIFFLFVCFVVASNSFATRDRLRMLANFLIIFGLVLAVFALVQHFTWQGKLFWVRPTPAAGAGTGGPFVNRNHFAGYMEMLIPIPMALALSGGVRGETRLLYGFAAAVMGVAQLASLSRGGLVSLAGGLLFLGVLSAWRGRGSHSKPASRFTLRPAYFIILTVVAIAAGVIWVGADFDILRRLSNDPLTTNGVMDRKSVWGDTLAMFRSHPLFGIGLGAFETVYPIYGRGNGTFLIQFAHNDYLQILADAGIAGGALALWFVTAIFRALSTGLKSSDRLLSGLALGGGAGIFALLIHSVFDFNLQIPSNALLFLLLAAVVSSIAALRLAPGANGMLSEASNRRRGQSPEKPRQPEVVTGVEL
jgi:O-antigen ligase